MSRKTPVAATLAIAAAAGVALALKGSSSKPRNTGSAPGRTARQGRFGDYRVVGKTVTLSKPSRDEIYRFWRDFTNLPMFMDNVRGVELKGDDVSEWRIEAPGGTSVLVRTKIAQDRPGELIAWRSVEGSQIDTEGRVAFREAPGDRGTQVELVIAYKPPAGAIGVGIAKLLQREPEVQARRDLRRFKSLMETGEIPTSQNRRNLDEEED